MKQALMILVKNKPGVLPRITGLITRRGFDIQSFAASPIPDSDHSRVVTVLTGETHSLSHLSRQLEKLVEVSAVSPLAEQEASGICQAMNQIQAGH